MGEPEYTAQIANTIYEISRANYRVTRDEAHGVAQEIVMLFAPASPSPEPKICRRCHQPVRPSEPQADTGNGEFQHLRCYQGVQRTPPTPEPDTPLPPPAVTLPDCMMPDGADPCKAFLDLQAANAELRARAEKAEAKIAQQATDLVDHALIAATAISDRDKALARAEAAEAELPQEAIARVTKEGEANTFRQFCRAEQATVTKAVMETSRDEARIAERIAIRERDEAREQLREAGVKLADCKSRADGAIRELNEARAGEAAERASRAFWSAHRDATAIEHRKEVARLTAAPAEMREACARALEKRANELRDATFDPEFGWRSKAEMRDSAAEFDEMAFAIRAIPLPAAAEEGKEVK